MEDEFDQLSLQLDDSRQSMLIQFGKFLLSVKENSSGFDFTRLSQENQYLLLKFTRFLLSDQELEKLSGIFPKIVPDQKSGPLYLLRNNSRDKNSRV